jgi:hypothetical protein
MVYGGSQLAGFGDAAAAGFRGGDALAAGRGFDALVEDGAPAVTGGRAVAAEEVDGAGSAGITSGRGGDTAAPSGVLMGEVV